MNIARFIAMLQYSREQNIRFDCAFSNAARFNKLILAANRKRAKFLAPTNNGMIDKITLLDSSAFHYLVLHK